MLRLSVCIEMVFQELPFLERMNAVKRLGFKAFEFWRWQDKEIDKIVEMKEKLELDVSSILASGYSLVDSESKPQFLKAVQETIPIAHKLNTKTVIVTTGNELEDIPRQTQHDNIVEALKEAAEIVENENITLVLEPLNVIVDHKGYYLSSSHEGFEIIRQVNHPNVKLLYDIYHQQITEGNLIQTITQNIGLIGHFHAADVPGRHEFGTGEINFPNVIQKIKELDYEGYIGLEFRPLKSSQEALKNIQEILKNICS